MPRYFFHIANGHDVVTDTTGTVLADADHARAMAGDIIGDMREPVDGEPPPNFDGWQVRICRDDGSLIDTIAIESNT